MCVCVICILHNVNMTDSFYIKIQDLEITLMRGNDIMKCIHLCQELETSEDKILKIPLFDARENIEGVIQIYIIKRDFIQNSCFGMSMNNIQ